jgi:hypothetical protein
MAFLLILHPQQLKSLFRLRSISLLAVLLHTTTRLDVLALLYIRLSFKYLELVSNLSRR